MLSLQSIILIKNHSITSHGFIRAKVSKQLTGNPYSLFRSQTSNSMVRFTPLGELLKQAGRALNVSGMALKRRRNSGAVVLAVNLVTIRITVQINLLRDMEGDNVRETGKLLRVAQRIPTIR